ncbi:MAG: APC family permease [Sphingomonadales bacterium]|nr:MAG: APC family permease [Sphingomonadales bacterium]
MSSSTPSFSRSMKMIGCLLITISCVTPASSVFIVMPGVVQQAGTGALAAALIAGFISLMIAFVYAELGSAFPLAGGEYAMVGRIMGPLAGFVVLGLNIFVMMLGIAIVALGLGTYVEAILPGTSPLADALICLVVTTLCALLSVRTNALVTGLFLGLELLALLVVAILGFTGPTMPWASLFAQPTIVDPSGALVPMGLNNLGLGVSAAIFAFYGFGSAIYLGEETQGASRHIARAILWAVVISVIAQVVPLAALLHSAADGTARLQSDAMFGEFVLARGGPALALTMNLAVALAILNANIAIIILASRMFFSTGRDEVWSGPINRALIKIDPSFKTPWVATLVTGALASMLCLVDFDFLLIATGTALMMIYGILCVAVIEGRRKGSTAHGAYRMRLFPLPPILAMLAFTYVIYTNISDPDTGLLSFLTTVAVLAVSAAYYLMVLRKRGEWVLRGPDD